MEYDKSENAQIEAAVKAAADIQLRELSDLQLAIIGGGQGEVVAV